MGSQKLKKHPTKVMCKVCQCETWHKILNETENRYNDDESGIWEITDFKTLQCLGCDNVCLLIESVFSEDVDPETGNPEVNKTIYPIPYKSDREPLKYIFYAPNSVASVYNETIKAFNNGLMILTGIGVRATIEAIAIDRGITVKGIETKIKKMVDLNIITSDGAELLRLVKDMGNKSAHEIKKHHHDDLSICVDIVEDIIRSLYILPKEAEHTRSIIDGKWHRVG